MDESSEVCRICFNDAPIMQDIAPFFPVIRLLANTKLLLDDKGPSKVCKSCANGVILANLFRIKVIESNAKYQDFLAKENIKRQTEKELLMMTVDSQVLDDDDNDMEIEYLNDENPYEIDVVAEKKAKLPTKKTHVTDQKQIQSIKENLKLKILGRASSNPKQICFLCPEPANMINIASPYKAVLNRIESIGAINHSERLCNKCLLKLKSFKSFFKGLDFTISHKFSADRCQFCSGDSENMVTASKGAFSIFNSLPRIGHETRISYNGKTCLSCVQLFNQIKLMREGYLSKRKIFKDERKVVLKNPISQKKKNLILKISTETQKKGLEVKKVTKTNDIKEQQKAKCKLATPIPAETEKPVTSRPKLPIRSSPKRKSNRIKELLKENCRKDSLVPDETETEPKEAPFNDRPDPKGALISKIMADNSVYSKPKSASLKHKNKKIRIRANPHYIEPNPDEPLPDDYQCHMSDFEELDSDSELPPVPFNMRLNVPFTPKYMKCPKCSMKFVNPYEMEAHIECIHNTTSNICSICQKELTTLAFAKTHKYMVHYAGFSRFAPQKQLCDICGLITKNFDDHMARDHLRTRPFSCNLCSYTSITKLGLKYHTGAVHLCDKRFKCRYCGKGFNYPADRDRHEIGVHTKKFKYICQFCEKCFLKKNFMRSHMRTQHPDEFYEES